MPTRRSLIKYLLLTAGITFGWWIVFFKPFDENYIEIRQNSATFVANEQEAHPSTSKGMSDAKQTSRPATVGVVTNSAYRKISSLLEMSCKMPIIAPMERDLMGYVHFFRDVICEKRMPNLASLSVDGHRLTVHNELEPYRQVRVPPFTCGYQGMRGGFSPHAGDIIWIGNETEVKEDVETEIPYDQFVVRCRDKTLLSSGPNDTLIYERAFAGFPADKQIELQNRSDATPDAPSLSILVLDSLARNQLLRHAPRTVEFMRRLGFAWLNGYVKVGDNSAVNLLPVLTGKTILPQVGGDGGEVIPNGTVVDLERTRFLWDIMKDRKCVTLFNDDVLDVRHGLFYYPAERFVGFRRPPTDFYFRAYHLFNARRMFYPPPSGGQCMKTGQMTSNEYLDIWEKFSTQFKTKCHFSLNFITELTHDESNNLGAVDDRLRTSLERLFANGVLENTALVLMGDHGNRIAPIQRSYAGRVEERAPLFALYVPPKFREKYPKKWANFKWNTNRLTSNFDVHRTLKGLLEMTKRSTSTGEDRGINLFEERVSASRTCEEAGIPPNFCLCMEERKLSRFHSNSSEYAAIRDVIRNYTSASTCLKNGEFRIADDRLQPLAINQMARHGIRNAADYDKRKMAQAALEIFFFDVKVNVQLLLSRRSNHSRSQRYTDTQLLFRIKHYVKESTFEIVDRPIPINNGLNNDNFNFDNLCFSAQ